MSTYKKDSSSIKYRLRSLLTAVSLAALLSFVLLSGYACTPTDAGTNDGSQSGSSTGSGGFTLEDSVEVEVDIQDK